MLRDLGAAARWATAAGRGRAGTWLLDGLLAVWFAVTVASQHPHRVFDRFRAYDPTGLLVPNWRFFAPEPAHHDFHLLHRVLTADGAETPWSETVQIAPRAWSHMAWFPDRRRDKAVFDICNELIGRMAVAGPEVKGAPGFELLGNLVEHTVRREHAGREAPQGFQFVVARHTGHDEDHDPDYVLVSPFVPLERAS